MFFLLLFFSFFVRSLKNHRDFSLCFNLPNLFKLKQNWFTKVHLPFYELTHQWHQCGVGDFFSPWIDFTTVQIPHKFYTHMSRLWINSRNVIFRLWWNFDFFFYSKINWRNFFQKNIKNIYWILNGTHLKMCASGRRL